MEFFQIQFISLKDLWLNTIKSSKDQQYYKVKNIEISIYISNNQYKLEFQYKDEFSLTCKSVKKFSSTTSP